MNHRTLLYLHGFASSPRGAKSQALGSIFAQRGITLEAPDLNQPSFEELSFAAMSRSALEAANRLDPAVVIGSSLGSLVALDLARQGIRAPLVLIAPALGFGDRWTSRVPDDSDSIEVYHYGAREKRKIHSAFFDEMQALSFDSSPPPVPVQIVMGTNDESVPYEGVLATWRRWEPDLIKGSALRSIEGGDHGLTSHLPDVTAAISRALDLAGQ